MIHQEALALKLDETQKRGGEDVEYHGDMRMAVSRSCFLKSRTRRNTPAADRQPLSACSESFDVTPEASNRGLSR